MALDASEKGLLIDLLVDNPPGASTISLHLPAFRPHYEPAAMLGQQATKVVVWGIENDPRGLAELVEATLSGVGAPRAERARLVIAKLRTIWPTHSIRTPPGSILPALPLPGARLAITVVWVRWRGRDVLSSEFLIGLAEMTFGPLETSLIRGRVHGTLWRREKHSGGCSGVRIDGVEDTVVGIPGSGLVVSSPGNRGGVVAQHGASNPETTRFIDGKWVHDGQSFQWTFGDGGRGTYVQMTGGGSIHSLARLYYRPHHLAPGCAFVEEGDPLLKDWRRLFSDPNNPLTIPLDTLDDAIRIP